MRAKGKGGKEFRKQSINLWVSNGARSLHATRKNRKFVPFFGPSEVVYLSNADVLAQCLSYEAIVDIIWVVEETSL